MTDPQTPPAQPPQAPTQRRRRRSSAPQGAPADRAPHTEPEAAPPAPAVRTRSERKPRWRSEPSGQPRPEAKVAAPARGKPRRPGREHADGGMRDLAGSGASQVGVSAALRARAVNRPTDEDLAAAERDVVIVRRNWRPPAGS